jgi:hypothetical protein
MGEDQDGEKKETGVAVTGARGAVLFLNHRVA